ncbi:MAG: hypothetical protein KDB22_00315 [Planctomycetales bacterium]|nr:hypothetical protein [Planctomycetales bacterium]
MKKRPAEIRRQQLPQAIVTPWVDLIYCGGASILVLIGLFVMSAVTPENRIFSRGIDWNNLVLFSLLINFPHCIACSSIWKIRNPQVRKQLFSHLAVK